MLPTNGKPPTNGRLPNRPLPSRLPSMACTHASGPSRPPSKPPTVPKSEPTIGTLPTQINGHCPTHKLTLMHVTTGVAIVPLHLMAAPHGRLDGQISWRQRSASLLPPMIGIEEVIPPLPFELPWLPLMHWLPEPRGLLVVMLAVVVEDGFADAAVVDGAAVVESLFLFTELKKNC